MKHLSATAAATAVLTLLPAVALGAPAPAPAADGHACLGRPATIIGSASSETIWGTPGADVIQAYGGNDVIYGLGGDDIICGGSGKDKVRGGAGADVLSGGAGNDLVWGGPGDDRLIGGQGDDRLFGRLGNDDLKGQAGIDKCRQDSRLLGGTGVVRDCEVPRATDLARVPYNQMAAGAGLRVKGDNSGGEVYLGTAAMGSGGVQRVEADVSAIKAGGTFLVELAFDAASNALQASVGGVELSYDFDDKAAPSCGVAEWDLLQVSIWERVAGLDLEFSGGSINGAPLGVDLPGASGMRTWSVEGIDFSSDWTVAGSLVATGAEWTGNENSKMEVMVGCKKAPQVAAG